MDDKRQLVLAVLIGTTGYGIYKWASGSEGQKSPTESRLWTRLATATLNVGLAMVGGWVKLATVDITVTKAMVGGWIRLADATLSVAVAIPGGWVKLASTTLSVIILLPGDPFVSNFKILSPTQSGYVGGEIYLTGAFSYLGPATTGRVYAAIGNQLPIVGFVEQWKSGWVYFDIGEALSSRFNIVGVTVPISGGRRGTYDVYAKMKVEGIGSDIFTPVYLDTITIV